ncbi:unnamed protein product [Paramecium sonneborni]|uniref:Uncharacterized protein n=1 Tax=Paramecium sonneborni TaxID=65129 RepID=A0A8S1Q8V2_9CILI|nr:unnamed protein product [Paramecium sonneborni]
MNFQGFLVKKTIQQFPIRQRPVYYEDYADQNFVLFINRKLADLRFKSGSNDLSAKRIMNLKIKIPKDKHTDGQKVKRKNSLKQKTVTEDESEKKSKYRFRSPQIKPEVKLASYLNDELLQQHSISQLFQEYKLANLKANLMKLRQKKSYQLNELNHIELEDDEQVKLFMKDICKNHPEIEVSQLLQVDVDKKQLEINTQKQTLQELIEKPIKQEQNENLQKMEQLYQKNLVNIYKQTRYDQFEPEFKKQGQINICKIKKQKEIQDQMYSEIFKTKHPISEHNNKQNYFHQQFKTPNKKHQPTKSQQFSNNIFLSQPDTNQLTPQTSVINDFKVSPLTTSIGTYSDIKSPLNSYRKNDFNLKLKTIIDKCDIIEVEQVKQNQKIQKKMKMMGKEMYHHLETARNRYQSQDNHININEEFEQFLQENQFKRKLIQYQVNQVQNLNEVLSQRAKREMTNNFMVSDFDKKKSI